MSFLKGQIAPISAGIVIIIKLVDPSTASGKSGATIKIKHPFDVWILNDIIYKLSRATNVGLIPLLFSINYNMNRGNNTGIIPALVARVSGKLTEVLAARLWLTEVQPLKFYIILWINSNIFLEKEHRLLPKQTMVPTIGTELRGSWPV